MSKGYSAALDLSGKEAAFALFSGEELLCSRLVPMRGRDSSGLALFVADTLKEKGVELGEVRRWSVGSGPGSFTGMRLAAALVEGWSFGKELESRCVPSAVALAANLDMGGKVGALFDGRNSELIFFGLEWKNGEFIPTGEEKILNADQAKEFFAEYEGRLIALESDEAALRKLTDVEITTFASIKPEALVLAKYKKFDNNLSDLVYIRPAVFV